MSVRVYTVAPQSVSDHLELQGSFRSRLSDAARDCEQAGWTGMLVPQNLADVDPWMVACFLGSVSTTLVPLLAVQPACLPPHTAAACAAAYAMLYGRPLYFNLVAGASDAELRRIGDESDHDERYRRLREYGHILRALLNGESVNHDTDYFTYRHLRLQPCPPVLAECRFFVAGSSPAGLRTAAEIADIVVTHPAPYTTWRRDFLDPLREAGFAGDVGIRIGILCRPDSPQAWQLAHQRFPASRFGAHATRIKAGSSNVWSQQLARLAVAPDAEAATQPGPPVYWLGAFRSGYASAPFLVGTYATVGAALGEYVNAGVGHLLLNEVHGDDFPHIRAIIRAAGA